MKDSKETYCPLFLIGFNPPKKGETYDPRTCKSNCAWYDKNYKQCIVQSIFAAINDNMGYLDEINCSLNGFTEIAGYDINE